MSAVELKSKEITPEEAAERPAAANEAPAGAGNAEGQCGAEVSSKSEIPEKKEEVEPTGSDTSLPAIPAIPATQTLLPIATTPPISTATAAVGGAGEQATVFIDKMDVLSSVEREIAEMHNVEPITPALAKRVSQEDSTSEQYAPNTDSDNVVLLEMKPRSCSSASSTHDVVAFMDRAAAVAEQESPVPVDTADDGTLEREELIAVLKGNDLPSEDTAEPEAENKRVKEEKAPVAAAGGEALSLEGVTIEGEGQFQIMEVIDDDLDEGVLVKDENPKKASLSNVAAFGKSLKKGTVLTPEEVRAVAMEQIAGLKHRRRKQDIKPIAVESTDLVSSLGADWSDDDPAAEETAQSAQATAGKSETTAASGDPKRLTSPQITSVVILQSNKEGAKATAPSSEDNKNSDSKDRDTKMAGEPALPLVLPQPTTGFKRTRIIKRKIIWDPDAPETQFSYAQLVRSSGKAKTDSATANTTLSKAAAAAKTSSAATAIKKEPQPAKKLRPILPKEKKMEPVAVEAAVEKKVARSNTPSNVKNAKAGSNTAQSTKRAISEESSSGVVLTVGKRRSHTPIANGAGAAGSGKKKKISEIDRLMGDEGAVNMLNALESERSKIESEQSGAAGDKPHRPLMRSRAGTVCEKIPRRDTGTVAVASTTKKETTAASSATAAAAVAAAAAAEAPPAATTKTKRNAAKQKPSSTWDYVYKQQASEDSMIIRRRSNSSYSSNASLRRLSVDGPATPQSSGVSEKPATSSASRSTPKATKASPKAANANASLPSSGGSGSKQHSSPTQAESKSFEFAKPESKTTTPNATQTATTTAQRSGTPRAPPPKSVAATAATHKAGRRTKSPLNALTNETSKRGAVRATVSTDALERAVDKNAKPGGPAKQQEYKDDNGLMQSGPTASTADVIVKKASKVAQIIFNTHKAKIDYTFTAQLMNKLVDILAKLSRDDDCNAVVMLTNTPHFCQGIDFTDLTLGSCEKRKSAALHMATAVKNYLRTLATFPKPLIAGVNGTNIGLGVTQLTLFDIVVASEKSSYETPYAKFGQLPEGFCFWNNSTKIRSTFKTKLFWYCDKLYSTESLLCGLINKLSAPEEVNEDAVRTAKKIASFSAESYRAMKRAATQNQLDTTLKTLDEEFDTIVAQWTSPECYEHFKNYLEADGRL